MNKFVPKSPDPDIIDDKDQALAKLGHLNKIVDQLNKLIPLFGDDTPYAKNLVPQFPGQIYIDETHNQVWIGGASGWYYVLLD